MARQFLFRGRKIDTKEVRWLDQQPPVAHVLVVRTKFENQLMYVLTMAGIDRFGITS